MNVCNVDNAAVSCSAFKLCDKVSGSWSPSISSVSCEMVMCEKPPPLLHGIVEGDSYNYGDFVMYSCLPGFDMKVKLIQSSFAFFWSGISLCGKTNVVGPKLHNK